MEIVYASKNFPEVNRMYYDLFEGKEPIMKFKPLENAADDSFRHEDVKLDNTITAELYVKYPLSVLVKDIITFSTLHELVSEIRRVYREIYDLEDETKTEIVKVNPQLINRGFSNGMMGIWGHTIEDLCIEEVLIFDGPERPIIQMFIGS